MRADIMDLFKGIFNCFLILVVLYFIVLYFEGKKK
jgi:hypothetical protein